MECRGLSPCSDEVHDKIELGRLLYWGVMHWPDHSISGAPLVPIYFDGAQRAPDDILPMKLT